MLILNNFSTNSRSLIEIAGLSMIKHQYGGSHSDTKVALVHDYLVRYSTALKKAKIEYNWETVYIDLFAGSGSRDITLPPTDELTFNFENNDSSPSIPGSASKAMELDNPFDHYFFCEKKKSFASQLEKLEAPFSSQKWVFQGDANEKIHEIIHILKQMPDYRGVIFLDPYDMSVKWETLKTICETGKLDIWYLVNLSGAVRNIGENASHAHSAYEKALGTKSWLNEMQANIKEATPQNNGHDLDLFGAADEQTADPTTEAKKNAFEKLFMRRFESILPADGLLKKTLRINGRFSTFALCFGMSNANNRAITLAHKLAIGAMKKTKDENLQHASISDLSV